MHPRLKLKMTAIWICISQFTILGCLSKTRGSSSTKDLTSGVLMYWYEATSNQTPPQEMVWVGTCGEATPRTKFSCSTNKKSMTLTKFEHILEKAPNQEIDVLQENLRQGRESRITALLNANSEWVDANDQRKDFGTNCESLKNMRPETLGWLQTAKQLKDSKIIPLQIKIKNLETVIANGNQYLSTHPNDQPTLNLIQQSEASKVEAKSTLEPLLEEHNNLETKANTRIALQEALEGKLSTVNSKITSIEVATRQQIGSDATYATLEQSTQVQIAALQDERKQAHSSLLDRLKATQLPFVVEELSPREKSLFSSAQGCLGLVFAGLSPVCAQ